MSGELLDSVKPHATEEEEVVKIVTDQEKMEKETLTVEKNQQTTDYGLLSVSRTKSPFGSGESSASTTPDAETLNVPLRNLSSSSDISADTSSTSCKVSVGTDTCRDLPEAAAEGLFKSPRKPRLSLIINVSTTNISAEGKMSAEDVVVFSHGNFKGKSVLDEVLQSPKATEEILADEAGKQTVSVGTSSGDTSEPMEFAAEVDDQTTSEDTTCSSKMDEAKVEEVSTDSETNLLKEDSESHSSIDQIEVDKPFEEAEMPQVVEMVETSAGETVKNSESVAGEVKLTTGAELSNKSSSNIMQNVKFETSEDAGILISIDSSLSSSNQNFSASRQSTKDLDESKSQDITSKADKPDLGNESEYKDQNIFGKAVAPPTEIQKIDLLCGSPRLYTAAIEESHKDKSVDTFELSSSEQIEGLEPSGIDSENIVAGPRDASCQTIIEDVRLEISTSQLASGSPTSSFKADRPLTLKGVDQRREIYTFEDKEDILKKMEFHSHDDNPTNPKRPRRGSSSEVTDTHTTASSSELLSHSESPSVTESSSQSEAFASRSISSASSPVPKPQSPQPKLRTQSTSGSSSEKTESTGVSSKDKSGEMNGKEKDDEQTKEEEEAAKKLFGQMEYERMRKSGPKIKVDFDVEQCSKPASSFVSDHSSLSVDQEDTCSEILFEKKSPSLDEQPTVQAESSEGRTEEAMDVDQTAQ